MRKTIFSLIMLTAIACQNKSSDKIMSQEDMAAYLIELHIAEAQVQNLRLKQDSAKVVFKIYENYLLEKNGITDSLFLDSYSYYMQHPDELEEIYTAVVDSIGVRNSKDEVKK